MKIKPLIRSKRWHIASPMPLPVQQALQDYPQTLAQILYNRGISQASEAQAFLEKRYLAVTDPFLLVDMDKAVARIQTAVAQEEMVIVYGDFDADGVTSCVLLVEALRGLGLSRANVQPYIPDRVDEGYGLNMEAITSLKEKGAHLIITVDCGIRSVAEVAHANAIGLDMIVTDHHSLGPELPPALAVINPKRPSAYPEKMLAGVGIAFKLAQALRQTMPTLATYQDEDLLDLVAIGTVADLAPLQGENRDLVIKGLAVLNKKPRPGIAAILKTARLKAGQISAESIGFGIGPRINAAGRLAHAYSAAKLLAANNANSANGLALELEELNQKRRVITADLGKMAEGVVSPDDLILIAGDSRFVSGVVGLVASRLTEQFYRPTIILEIGEEESRASCRSIPEFHITDALDSVAHLLVRHGGHAQAAGFTIRNEHLEQFKEEMRAIATAQLADKALAPAIEIDVELPLGDINWALKETLQRLEPTGYANPTPVFVSRAVEVYENRAVGQNGDHLQVDLGDGRMYIKGIGFNLGHWAGSLPPLIDIAYTLGVNEWNGQTTLQLVVQDIKPTPFPHAEETQE